MRFFSNQQTVEASGVDVVATLPFDLGSGVSTLTLAANWSDIELSEFSRDFTSDNRRLQIERGRPRLALHPDLEPRPGTLAFHGRARYYGEYYDAPTNDGSVAFFPEPDLLVDAEVSVQVTEAFSALLGLSNAFDEYPDTNPHGEVAGLIYPEQSPYGFNGGFTYLRLSWSPW